MASSRIFIKGLPPTITEEELRKHFGTTAAITDARLISHRRIGYVGYKTPDEAAKAVKYFNRTFIRMSKIGVEIARPVGAGLATSYGANLTIPSRSRMRLYRPRGKPSANRSALMQPPGRRSALMPLPPH